jgi:glycosyltransferase involved in cell wall biosynthesis
MSPDKLENCPAPIAPRVDSEPHPLWSVFIPVCNRIEYLDQTLKCILDQDPGAPMMQIEVIDNSTADYGVEALVQEIGKGRISYYQQPQHLSMAENWNTCIERSRGDLVHILHDDDYVSSTFYLKIERLAEKYTDAGLLVSRCSGVDETGGLLHVSGRLEAYEEPSHDPVPNFWPNRIYCPGVVVRRSVYEKIGGFDPSVGAPADYEMWMRAIISCGIVALPNPEAYYREHRGSYTGQNSDNAKFLIECGRVAKKVSFYDSRLDFDVARKSLERQLIRSSSRHFTNGAFDLARRNFEAFLSITSIRGLVVWFIQRLAKGRLRQLLSDIPLAFHYLLFRRREL